MRVLFNDLRPQWDIIKNSLMPELQDLFQNGPYILGKQVLKFEEEFAKICRTSYAIGVSNGTDALKLTIQALDCHIPKEVPVLIPANSYIADALAPMYLGHPVVLIDCDHYYNMSTYKLSEWIYNNNSPECIIIPVHLYGQPCDMSKISEIAPKAVIIGDCSQAHGATIKGIPVGSFGTASIFSLYPTKNLGAMGDAGIVVTNNEQMYKKIMALRNYGSYDRVDYHHMGWNNRLDEIQALILRHKIPYLEQWNNKRKEIAAIYNKHLSGYVDLPKIAPYADGSVYHMYTIRSKKRDHLQRYLKEHEIDSLVRYPLPLHKVSLFKENRYCSYPNSDSFSSEILCLPMHPFMTEEQVMFVIQCIKEVAHYEA